MQTSFFFFLFLAIALPSLRTSPFLNRTWLVAMSAIVLFYAAVLSFNVVYIQSIGSGIGFFSDIFTNFLLVQYCSAEGIFSLLFLSSLLPIKPKRLTNLEKSQFTLSDE